MSSDKFAVANVLKFEGNNSIGVNAPGDPQSRQIDTSLKGNTMTSNEKIINLGVEYKDGVSESEINKKTGDVIYITNRSVVQRDLRQKEDIKIVLEF